MKRVHIITATLTPQTAATFAAMGHEAYAPMCVKYRSKAAADKCESELRASGIWNVTRTTKMLATHEEFLMALFERRAA